MATRKQKHAAGLAKHEAFMAEQRQSGLQAQKRDREYRERKANRLAKKTSPETESE